MTKPRNASEEAKAAQELELYGPPQCQDDDVVDMVCSIMDDDGPKPMRDMKPAQRLRNAAEQFDLEHQGVYEARGRNSRGAVDAVALHNSGYPKMRDELAKRRSTAKVSAFNAQRTSTIQETAYDKCNSCIKKKKVNSKKKSAPKRRVYKKSVASRQSMRITKPKTRGRRSASKIYKLSKIKTSKGCQCSTLFSVKHKKSGTTDNMLEDKMAVEEGSLQCRDLNINYLGSVKRSSNASEGSRDDSKHVNPDSDPSVSSYNSFASLDHEPMVSN